MLKFVECLTHVRRLCWSSIGLFSSGTQDTQSDEETRATLDNFRHKHSMRWRTRACNLAMHFGGHFAKSDHKQRTQLDSRRALAGIARVFGVCQQRLMCGQRGCRRLLNRSVTPVSPSFAFQNRTTVLIQKRLGKRYRVDPPVTVGCASWWKSGAPCIVHLSMVSRASLLA